MFQNYDVMFKKLQKYAEIDNKKGFYTQFMLYVYQTQYSFSLSKHTYHMPKILSAEFIIILKTRFKSVWYEAGDLFAVHAVKIWNFSHALRSASHKRSCFGGWTFSCQIVPLRSHIFFVISPILQSSFTSCIYFVIQ